MKLHYNWTNNWTNEINILDKTKAHCCRLSVNILKIKAFVVEFNDKCFVDFWLIAFWQADQIFQASKMMQFLVVKVASLLQSCWNFQWFFTNWDHDLGYMTGGISARFRQQGCDRGLPCELDDSGRETRR